MRAWYVNFEHLYLWGSVEGARGASGERRRKPEAYGERRGSVGARRGASGTVGERRGA